MQCANDMRSDSRSSRPSVDAALPPPRTDEDVSGNDRRQATTVVRGSGSTSQRPQEIHSTATNIITSATAAAALPIPASSAGKQSSNKRRYTADTVDPSIDSIRAEYQPVVLRNPVQPWTLAWAGSPTTAGDEVGGGYIRPFALDPARRTFSFNDALVTSDQLAEAAVAPAPLSPSLAGKSTSSASMIATTSRVAPYYYPSSSSHQTAAAAALMGNSFASSVPTISSMQQQQQQQQLMHHNDHSHIQEGMTSMSPTRTTFIERHSRGAQQQHRQRTLSDMHPSNFAALHTALAKAVIAAGEDDKSAQNNRRRTQSCDVCRIRKVKCVRQEDDSGVNARCKQCEANDAKCTYVYVPKKPGPQKPGPQSSTASGSSTSSKSNARRTTTTTKEERQHSRALSGSAAGLLHLGGVIAQQRTLSAQDLQTPSILQQLSPVYPAEAQWTSSSSAYARQPSQFSPNTSSDAVTGDNPFDNHMHAGAAAVLPTEFSNASSYNTARLDGFPPLPQQAHHHHQLEHNPSSYSTSSVSASPSVSTFAHASAAGAQGIGGMSSSPQSQTAQDNVESCSPLISLAMTASSSSSRPQQLSVGTSGTHPSQQLPPPPIIDAAHMKPIAPAAATFNTQHQHAYAPPLPLPSSVLPNINTEVGRLAGFAQMPLHSAPPTMTHFEVGNMHVAGSTMTGLHPANGGGGSSSDPYNTHVIWPPRNASFSHGLPTIPNTQFPTPHSFAEHISMPWQQQQQQQQYEQEQSSDEQFRIPYPDNHHNNGGGGMW